MTNITLKEMNPDIGDFYVTKEKFYLPQGGEVSMALAAFAQQVPLVIDGPTGTGKSSLVEHLCYRLGKGWKPDPLLSPDTNTRIQKLIHDAKFDETGFPLFTIQGHDDLTADDLRGRVYIVGQETMWLNGKAQLASRYGGMFYFDEPAEARPDTLVVTHSLSDHRRVLDIEKLGFSVPLHDTTFPVMTYNSMYQDPRKRFKPSTSQRFAHLFLGYPQPDLEQKIVEGALLENHITVTKPLRDNIKMFIAIAGETRNMAKTDTKLQEGASPREVLNAAKLAAAISDEKYMFDLAMATLCYPLSTDKTVRGAIQNLISNKFKERER